MAFDRKIRVKRCQCPCGEIPLDTVRSERATLGANASDGDDAGSLGATVSSPLLKVQRCSVAASHESAPPSPPSPRSAARAAPRPTRKEAEAAAKARAKTPRTRKELAAAQRSDPLGVEQDRPAGDARRRRALLPGPRPGPERRFVRDFVDARFSLVELVIPLLLVTMILGYSGNAGAAPGSATRCCSAPSSLVVIDMVLLRFRLRRELAAPLPGPVRQGPDLLRRDPGAADEVHAAAEAAGARSGSSCPSDYR